MTTALEAFEEWLREEIKFNEYDDVGITLRMVREKLEALKKEREDDFDPDRLKGSPALE